MRVLNERFANANVDLLDGIKVFDERGWAQVLPDPDEPLVHIYAEGETPELSTELEEEFRLLVGEVIEGEEIARRRESDELNSQVEVDGSRRRPL